MKAYYISNNKNKLILFFNGWSMDHKHLMRLISPEYDTLILYDYTDLFFEQKYSDLILNYKDVIVIGWSMGVFVANVLCRSFNNISFSLAINGTLTPISDDYGIPYSIFDATLRNFNLQTREKFYKRMFKNISLFEQFLETQPERAVDDQKEELISLQNHINEKKIVPNIFNQAIISKYDKIIPAKNQINYWTKQNINEYKLLDEGHYPFFLWETFEEIIEYAKRN